MKILFVTHSFLPYSSTGVEIYTYNTTRRLLDSNNDVLIYSAVFDPKREPLERFQYKYNELKVEAFYHNLSSGNFVESYRDKRKDKIFSDLVKRFKPDIIHIQHLMFHSVDYLKIAKEMNIPVVLTLHDFYYYCPNLGLKLFLNKFICKGKFPLKCAICFKTSNLNVHRLDTFLYKNISEDSFIKKIPEKFPHIFNLIKSLRLLRRGPSPDEIIDREKTMLEMLGSVDVIIAPSMYYKNFFEGYSGHPDIIHLDYGFVFPSKRIKKSSKSTKVRLGFVGTISRHKGAHLLIDISKRYKDSVKIHVWGNDRNDRVLSKKLKSLANIKYNGLYNPEEISSVYGGIDYLIVPSIWEENSPLVIHESLLYNTPVIASRKGGNAELIIEGKNGFLFDIEDRDSLFSILEKIISGNIRIKNLDKSTVLSMDEHIKKLIEVYKRLVRNTAFQNNLRS